MWRGQAGHVGECSQVVIAICVERLGREVCVGEWCGEVVVWQSVAPIGGGQVGMKWGQCGQERVDACPGCVECVQAVGGVGTGSCTWPVCGRMACWGKVRDVVQSGSGARSEGG